MVHVPATADCSCRTGQAGEIASALCRVYKTNRRAKAPFAMLYRASGEAGHVTTMDGTVVYAPSQGTVSVYYDRPSSGVEALPTKQELTALFSFFGSPICRDHAIRALNPADFSYSGGSLVEAVSDDRHVLFYVRRDEGTLHGLSTRWTDGRKNRYTFGAWTFTDDGR